MKNYIVLLLLSICLWCYSCNNTLEINAPYQDNTFVYGLLNARDSVHYVRIHKGFLPDPNANTDALQTAKIPDSSQYKPGQISAALFSQKLNGSKVKVADFQYTLIGGGSSTDFAPNTVIYKTPKIGRLDTTQTYSIEIKKADGQIVSAQTLLIGSFETEFPNKITGYTLNLRRTFRILRQPNTEVYKAIIHLEYEEFINGTNNTVLKKLDYDILPQTTSTSDALINTVSLRDFLLSSISTVGDPSGLRRSFVKVEMEVWLAGSSVARNIQAGNSYSALSQQKALYTNVTNGFGVFSTKAYRKFVCKISIRDLQSDRDLQALKFVE